MKTIISIDPGSKGFISILRPDGSRKFCSIADNSMKEIAGFLYDEVTYLADDVVIIMEEVHAIRGSAAGATFSFGKIVGFLQGVIITLGVPYHLVQPKEWQKEIWINADKVFKSGKTVDTKKTSINAALRLFPNVDFRRTDKCEGADDNKVDAVLIGEYARRKNL